MNNLKRVLSLALAGTMLAGMMVVGASAADYKDFKDSDEIQHTEAVSVMATLGVLNGKNGGVYDPKGTVTRAEMAKIICVMRNGGVDPTLGSGSANLFTDTTNHWARGYIEYCANLGIINGMGNGTFAPDAPVTGAQAAKMLLVALGYDSDVFGFTGRGWETNVNVQANEAKLYDEIKTIDTSAGLSRDNTAQMAYNALSAKVMNKTYDKVLSNGEISYNYALSSTTTFLNKYFDAKIFVGTFKGNKDTGDTTVDGQIKVFGKLDTDDGVSNSQADRNATFPSDLDISNIGEEVKVIFKDGKGGAEDKPDKNDTIYGVFNTGKTEVINAVKADIGDLKSTEQKIKIDGTKYDVADTVIVVKNYDTTNGTTTYDKTTTGKKVFGTSTTNSDLTEALKKSNGDTIKFVCNDDGKINAAYVVEYALGTVTAVNSEKITISGLGSIKLADNDVYEGVAKNDVVVYSKLYKSAVADAFVTVTKAEKVSGTVTGYTVKTANTSSSKVVLDGTTYNVMNEAAMPTSVGGETGKAYITTGDIGESFDLYLVNGYVAAAVQTSESASNYSLVINDNNGVAGGTFNEKKIQVLAADGNKTILTVDKDGDTSFAIGDIVTWTGTADKAKVKVEKAFATSGTNYAFVPANGTIYNKTSKTVDGIVTATDCVLFVTTDGDTTMANLTNARTFKAYDIRSLKDVKAGTAAVHVNYVVKDSKVVAVFALTGTKPSGATSNAVYGIVSAYNGVIEIDDTEYNQYTIVSNGDSYTANVKTGTLSKGSVVGFAPTSDDLYDNASSFALLSNAALSSVSVDGSTYTADVVAVKNYDEGDKLLTYYTGVGTADKDGAYTNPTGQTTKAVDDDLEIVYVNVDGDAAGDEIGINAFDAMTGYYNAIVIMNSDGVITNIIVETSNEGNVYAY